MAIQIDLFRSMESEAHNIRLDKLEKSLGDVRRGVFARLNSQEKNLLQAEHSLQELYRRMEFLEAELSMKVKMG
jgi:hypothetical protein